jgi:peptidoglycan/xylan/chitin deacetylase (PgdA/CDA1 family)
MYHRVITELKSSNHLSQGGIVISKAVFEKQMRFLRGHFNVLPLNEFIECIEGRKTFGPNSCLVTFDDGWRDNFQNAYPLLKEMGIPATIFVATDFVGENKLFWQERITGLLYGLHDALESERDVSRYVLRHFPDMAIRRILLCKRDRVKEEILGYIRMLKGKANEEIDESIQRLTDLTLKVKIKADEERAFLDWDEIKVMAGNGISFGSHGKSHVILTRLSKCEIEKEALESRELLEKKLGVPVCTFSYRL